MIMNTSTPLIRLGLLALTGAVILGAAALHADPESAVTPTSAALPTVTLETITVRPSVDDTVAAAHTSRATLPVLPTVHVTASEEEILAARLDPSDGIQIFSSIRVQPNAEEIAAALNATAVAQVGEDDDSIGRALTRAVVEPHRLRLDMPYYSFGKALTRSK